MSLLAIDPGNIKSGWTIIDKDNYRPMGQGVTDNEEFLVSMQSGRWVFDEMAIEGYEFQGRKYVGQSAFDTCMWIGRFETYGKVKFGVPTTIRKRSQIRSQLGVRGGDVEIKRALVRRFANKAPNYGKGTKDDPGWFHGFADHSWQAYACGVAHIDLAKREALFAGQMYFDGRQP